ncbi:MAG: glycosyltransferase, partial [Ignavibacteriota bacterium]
HLWTLSVEQQFYLLYPLLIRQLARIFPMASLRDESFRPQVSIILAVYNEESVLLRCIDSLLRLDYPIDLIEIIIGSDGSSDRTNQILTELSVAHEIILPVYFPERRGKMSVINDLAELAKGDILFFADADITLSANALKAQIRHFADPMIGAVAGSYRIQVDSAAHGHASSEKYYASHEQNIRLNEALFCTTVGVFGGNYSIRHALWRPLPDGLVHDDTFVAYNIMDKGKRVYCEPESISTDTYNRTLKDEFRRKSRSASRGYHTLTFFPRLVGFAGGKNSFLLWSHKLLRWLSPFLMLTAFILSVAGLFIYAEERYFLLVLFFCTIATITFLGWILEYLDIRVPIIRQSMWFVSMNIAYISGTIKFLTKSDESVWSQAGRPVIDQAKFLVKEVTETK